jgi:cyclase
MLKKRIIAHLPIFNGIVVQSIGFNKYLPVGKPEIAVEFLNSWGVDEIILNNITATRLNKEVDFDLVRRSTKKCFVPITAGGGIKSLEDVKNLIHSGADKVCLNQAFIHNPQLVSKIAHDYGDQCIVASIDVIKVNNKWWVFDYLKKKTLAIPVIDYIKRAIDLGSGEILINSVDRDGKYCGYDLELFNYVEGKISVPILASGGAANSFSIVELFENTNVSAGCVGNYFHFFEHSINITKKNLSNKNLNIRLESSVKYDLFSINLEGRLKKLRDKELQNLLYIKIEKEII